MRNRIFLALGIASLLSLSAAQAAIVREWDSTQNKWVTYDTKSPIFFKGSSKSAVTRDFVKYSGPYGPKTIVINTGERRLYFIYEPGKAIKYGIGVGREGFTWSGTDTVSMKAEWPGWTPPPEMIQREKAKGRILPAHMAGGLNNPLGARALYIGSRIYRIHGSNEPWTIGHAVSSGCIRMTNDDVIDLYDRVPVGTRVVVLPEGADALVADTNAPDEPLPPKPVEPKKTLVKAPLPVKAPARAVIAIKAPADEPAPAARKTKPVVVAKAPSAPVADKAIAAVPTRPTKDDLITASIQPAPAPVQPKVVVIIPKVSADSTVGGGNAGEMSAAVTVPVASATPPVTGDRLVGSANN